MTHTSHQNKISEAIPMINYIGPDNLVNVIKKANIIEATKKGDVYAIPIVFDKLSLEAIQNLNENLKLYKTPNELITHFFENRLYDENEIVTNDKPLLDNSELYGTVFTTKNKTLADFFREFIANNYNPNLSKEGNSVYMMNEIFGHAIHNIEEIYRKIDKHLNKIKENNKKLFTSPK
ncbi:hypothetical protein GF374_01105 [Candidatus Woesearchaeota archaeon]|nr:hypothetical protein [Candidatus Woesearchaeota archaeon]